MKGDSASEAQAVDGESLLQLSLAEARDELEVRDEIVAQRMMYQLAVLEYVAGARKGQDAATVAAGRPKRGKGHRTPARSASAAALGPRTPPCNENTAALIHAFTRGALAGDRMGERSQLVRRLESEALAMANGAQLRQGGQGARPASSPPRRPVTAPSLASLGGSPAL